ncbi:MAG: hypothetical protein MUQ67_01775 [Pirellulales bacterium]|jgi:hypothetical protein|nr:hypothetical protein [Pirellulales bacterium]MDO7688060.1 hypothetical protein [Pirellulales bacterium]
MSRQIKNPFYIVLGVIGFTFTITAASYCLSVLRGIRPQATLTEKSHPLEEIMDRYGTSLLTGQLIVLAIATVGAVAVDHVNGQKKQNSRHPQHLTDDSNSESDSPLETKRL